MFSFSFVEIVYQGGGRNRSWDAVRSLSFELTLIDVNRTNSSEVFKVTGRSGSESGTVPSAVAILIPTFDNITVDRHTPEGLPSTQRAGLSALDNGSHKNPRYTYDFGVSSKYVMPNDGFKIPFADIGKVVTVNLPANLVLTVVVSTNLPKSAVNSTYIEMSLAGLSRSLVFPAISSSVFGELGGGLVVRAMLRTIGYLASDLIPSVWIRVNGDWDGYFSWTMSVSVSIDQQIYGGSLSLTAQGEEGVCDTDLSGYQVVDVSDVPEDE